MVKVLFVCLGNICRSPSAEGIFLNFVAAQGLQDVIHVDSAGTSDYHIGELPDARMRKAALQAGYELVSRARQVKAADFATFDYIVAMDLNNLANLQKLQAQSDGKAEVVLLGSYSEKYPDQEVPDPYFGGEEGFHEVIRMLEECLENFLQHVKEQKLQKQ